MRNCIPKCAKETKRKKRGFTLIELLIVIALITLFTALTVPFGISFYRRQLLEKQTADIANYLKVAQSHAQTAKNDSDWGIKFYPDDQDCIKCYVMFQGESYASRSEANKAYDKVFEISSGIEIEGAIEVVFEKRTGKPSIITE